MSASPAGSSTRRPSTGARSGRRCGRPDGRTAWSPRGYRAIDALRIEKGYRVWSADVTPDETPYEAGLGFAVALDKAVAGDGARRARRGAGGRASQGAPLPRAGRPARRLRRQRAGERRWAGRRPGHVGRVRLHGRAVDRLRVPRADARWRSGRGARSRCSASGSASRSSGSRSTTRRACASGRSPLAAPVIYLRCRSRWREDP